MPKSQLPKPPIPGSTENRSSSTPYWTPDMNKKKQNPSSRSVPSGNFSASSHSNTKTASFSEATVASSASHSALPHYFGRIRPASAAVLLFGLLAFSTVLTSATYYSGTPSPTYTDDVSFGSSYTESMLEIGDPILFASGSDTILTLPVTKLVADQYLFTPMVSVEVETLSDVGKAAGEPSYTHTYTQWIDLPDLDFYTDTVYVNTILYDVQPEDIIRVDAASGEIYQPDELQDYLWSIDVEDPESLDETTLRKLLSRSHEFARYEIEITDDGVEEQNGLVVAKVTKPDVSTLIDGSYFEEDGQVTGSCNILFKKDGEIVFADVYHYPNQTISQDAFAFAYTAPYELPEYDSVEIIDLR